MFSTVRVNSQIFILDKANRTFEIGTVSDEPKLRYTTVPMNPQYNSPYNQQQTIQVVDLKVQTPSGTQTLSGLPTDKNVFDNPAKTVFVTEDKETMLNELRGLKNQSENHLKLTKYHEEMIPKYDEWIGVLSPEDAEKKRNEEKIANLEKGLQQQQEMNRQLIEQMQALMSKLDGGNAKQTKNKEQ
jgi:hypothetical protein